MGTSRWSKRAARWASLPTAGALLAVLAVALLSGAPAPSGFGWLRPTAPPPDWALATTPSGAALAYPPGWRRIQSDRGTVSAAPAGGGGPFAGYLNATPQSGGETLDNWSRFRVAHVAGEGARHVQLLAAATRLPFRSGHGSCVIDSYSTRKARFRELACIVSGDRATTVVVAAARDSDWERRAPTLERAVAGFET